jgi:hypothetical protein
MRLRQHHPQLPEIKSPHSQNLNQNTPNSLGVRLRPKKPIKGRNLHEHGGPSGRPIHTKCTQFPGIRRL